MHARFIAIAILLARFLFGENCVAATNNSPLMRIRIARWDSPGNSFTEVTDQYLQKRWEFLGGYNGIYGLIPWTEAIMPGIIRDTDQNGSYEDLSFVSYGWASSMAFPDYGNYPVAYRVVDDNIPDASSNDGTRSGNAILRLIRTYIYPDNMKAFYPADLYIGMWDSEGPLNIYCIPLPDNSMFRGFTFLCG